MGLDNYFFQLSNLLIIDIFFIKKIDRIYIYICFLYLTEIRLDNHFFQISN